MDAASQPAEQQVGLKALELKRLSILGLVCLSHAINHLSSGIMAVFYPIFRDQFGLSYSGIGALSIVNQVTATSLQGTYGVTTRFLGRGTLLGLGNWVIALGGLGLGFAGSYPQTGFWGGYQWIALWTGVRSAGSSAQNPVGAAMLASEFSKERAQVLTLHQAAGNVGGWIAPVVAGAMLYVMGWREVVWILSVPSILMGLVYFGLRGALAGGPAAGGRGKGRVRVGLADYRVALRNRNVMLISLVMMLGAAGRGTGVLNTYLTPWLVDRYGVSYSEAGFIYGILTLGGVIGPIALGWLADHTSRRMVLQLTLLGSALFSFTIVFYPSVSWALWVHVFLAGGFIWARSPLMETIITQASDESTLDTLLSVYFLISFASGPVWTLMTGLLFDRFGAMEAFAVMGASYLVGIGILSWVRTGPRPGQAPAAP